MHGGPAGASNTWELTHPLDGNIQEAYFTICPEKDSLYLFNIMLGAGNIKNGSIRDTDWDANGVMKDLSYSTSQGDTSIFAFSVDYLITDIEKPYALYTTVTYNYLTISANYRDPTIMIDTYVSTNTSFAMKWQIYDLIYESPEIGLKGKLNILKDLSVEASLGYSPFVKAEYKGTRYPDTAFEQPEHIIARGSALSYQLCLSYNLVNQFSVQFGYKYNSYRTKGEDQSDSPWAGSWEELDSDFKGCFFSAGIKF